MSDLSKVRVFHLQTSATSAPRVSCMECAEDPGRGQSGWVNVTNIDLRETWDYTQMCDHLVARLMVGIKPA